VPGTDLLGAPANGSAPCSFGPPPQEASCDWSFTRETARAMSTSQGVCYAWGLVSTPRLLIAPSGMVCCKSRTHCKPFSHMEFPNYSNPDLCWNRALIEMASASSSGGLPQALQRAVLNYKFAVIARRRTKESLSAAHAWRQPLQLLNGQGALVCRQVVAPGLHLFAQTPCERVGAMSQHRMLAARRRWSCCLCWHASVRLWVCV
jgi:hypothetical protein